MKSYLGIGFSVFLSVAGNNPPKCFIHHSQNTVLPCKKTNNQVSFFYVIKPINHRKIEGEDKEEDDRDTVRVRIWRALASGEELSLKELGVATKERSRGDLRAHLRHVEKQAKTLRNKNMEWRKRRGLPTENVKIVNKLRIKTRLVKKEMYIRLG